MSRSRSPFGRPARNSSAPNAVLAQGQVSWNSRKAFAFALLLEGAALYIADAANPLAFTPSINTAENVLPDATHSFARRHGLVIDHSDPGSAWFGVCDKLMLLPLSLLVLCLARAKFAGARVLVLTEFLHIHAALLVLRALLILSTTLPSPVRACHGAAEAPGNLQVRIWCNDCIFSGHTSLNLLCVLTLSHAPRAGRCALLASFVSAASQDHYTVDVLLAWTHTCGAVALRRPQLLAAWRGEELGRAYSSISWEDDDHRH